MIGHRVWPRDMPDGTPPVEVSLLRSWPWWASWSAGWDYEAHPHEWQLTVRLGPLGVLIQRVHHTTSIAVSEARYRD